MIPAKRDLPGNDAARNIAAELYLDLLKKVLTRYAIPEQYEPADPSWGPYRLLFPVIRAALRRKGLSLLRRYPFDRAAREEGKDWPPQAETMIGLRRLEQLQSSIATVLTEDVPGDLIETGVWRGGASIFMRAVLKAYGDESRRVWLADSFQGLPKPNPGEYPADKDDTHWTLRDLPVSLEEVKENFARFGLLDERVKFLQGWFKDTLPTAPLTSLCILRLDGDMYESTIQALDALYPKLSIGGFCIVDDYHLPGCRAAVTDYRRDHAIEDEIHKIDWAGVYWRRGA